MLVTLATAIQPPFLYTELAPERNGIELPAKRGNYQGINRRNVRATNSLLAGKLAGNKWNREFARPLAALPQANFQHQRPEK